MAVEPTTIDASHTGEYTLDSAHSKIGFVARHAMITKVRGTFTEVSGTGHLDAADPSRSSFRVTIDVASVDTRSADRDHQLRTNDFLDVPTYPRITFESTSVAPIRGGRFTVIGDLTVKDVTKPVTIDLELTELDQGPPRRIGLRGNATVNRKDWGVNWNAALEAGGVLVGEKVMLTVDVAASKNIDQAASKGRRT